MRPNHLPRQMEIGSRFSVYPEFATQPVLSGRREIKEALEALEKHKIYEAIECLGSIELACGRIFRDVEVRRVVVADKWVQSAEVAVASGTDLVATIVASAAFTTDRLNPEVNDAFRLQILNRTMTALGIEIVVSVTEDAGGGVFVYNEDLSQQVAKALGSAELTILRKASDTPSLAPTPLYVYENGGITLPPDLWQYVADDRFRLRLTDPGDLRVVTQSVDMRLTWEIRFQGQFEDIQPSLGDGDSKLPSLWCSPPRSYTPPKGDGENQIAPPKGGSGGGGGGGGGLPSGMLR